DPTAARKEAFARSRPDPKHGLHPRATDRGRHSAGGRPLGGRPRVLSAPVGNKAEAVARALIDHLGRLPTHLRRSLTWDRGGEMAQHSAITAALGLPVFFS